MSKFDLKVCKERDGGKARHDTHALTVEVLAGPFDENGWERYVIKNQADTLHIVHSRDLSNLSPPAPAEPEVRWVHVAHEVYQGTFGGPCHLTSAAYFNKDDAKRANFNRAGELHPVYMGCLDPQELWDKHGIAVSPYLYRDRTDWRIGRRDAVRGERWNVLSVTGGWIQHSCDNVSREATFPTYGSALKAASDAAKSL